MPLTMIRGLLANLLNIFIPVHSKHLVLDSRVSQSTDIVGAMLWHLCLLRVVCDNWCDSQLREWVKIVPRSTRHSSAVA